MKLLTAIDFVLLAVLSACKDNDRPRRDRDERPPVVEEPSTPPALDFRSTTGSGVREEPNDTFSIPACGKGKLGYVTTRWETPLRATATMTVTFTVVASPDAKIEGAEFRDKHEAGRAAMHFQRRNRTKTASSDPYALDGTLYDRGYRQWSRSSEMLTPGDHMFSVVLTHDQWRTLTTDKERDAENFSTAMLDPANAGITLSGAQSAGHGVCMAAGTAKLTVTGISVQ